MSAATTVSPRQLPRRSRTPGPMSPALWLLVLAAIALSISLITIGLWGAQSTLAAAGWMLVAWVGVVAVVGAASVTSESGSQLGLDMPLLLAAGFIFGPGIGGAIAFLAYVDVREFRGEIGIIRALYNRAQTALSVIMASLLFKLVGGEIGAWPQVILASSLAVAADCLVNYSLVVAVRVLHDGVSFRDAVSGLRLGRPAAFALTYLSYGLLGLILAEIFLQVGVWGLAAFVMPAVLARQAFEQSRRLEIANDELKVQSSAFHEVSSRVADERRDERLAVAADLHDEVLPPLYNVHLMGQVLRQDLAAGRLLEFSRWTSRVSWMLWIPRTTSSVD